MILMAQIFDITANENALNKRNELEFAIFKNQIWFLCRNYPKFKAHFLFTIRKVSVHKIFIPYSMSQNL